MGKIWSVRRLAVLICGFVVSASAQVGSGRKYTTADYARAEAMLSYNVTPLVYHTVERPVWVDGDRFWYRDRGPEGFTFTLVDPAKGGSAPAFDHAKLAAAMVAAKSGAKVDEHFLRLTDLTFEGGKEVATVMAGAARLRCDVSGEYTCAMVDPLGSGQEAAPVGRRRSATNEVVSPDGSKAAFIRDWNLWMREVKSGKETQLTKDGVKDFGYATDNAGWKHSDAAILVWSPDSKKIATFQQDQRKTGEMYLVPVTNRHPKLEAWKYPLVGDKDVTMIERVVIDVGKKKVVRLKMPPDQHRSTICDDVSCDGGWEDVQWADDSQPCGVCVDFSRSQAGVAAGGGCEQRRCARGVYGDGAEVFRER